MKKNSEKDAIKLTFKAEKS